MTNDGVQPLKANRIPLSTQAQNYLLNLIESERYGPGEQLPSESELAAQLGISRPTLREALRNLERDGLIVRKHGVGTFVSPGYEHRLESGLERLESILELATRQGLAVTYQALQVQAEKADPALAEQLQLPAGAPVTSIRRALVVGEQPIAYMVDLVPATILTPEDVDSTFNGSVLDLLRKKQELHITQAVANIVALNADGFLIENLQVEPDQAVLLLEEVLFDGDGMPVEFSRNYFVPEFFRFRVVRR